MMKNWKRNLFLALFLLVGAALAGRAVYFAQHATGAYTKADGGQPIYDWDLVPNADAATGTGPQNFPYGVYNNCSGNVKASAGLAQMTALAPCNVTQMHGCVAFARTNVTPVAADQNNCQVASMTAVIASANGSAVTGTATGITILHASASFNATDAWLGY